MERVALFVDGSAMFYAQRDNGWHIDYRNVFHYFTDNREVAGAWYFTATPPAVDSDRLERYRKFKYAMTQIGYSVKDKEVKVLYDKNTGQVRLKGNLEVRRAVLFEGYIDVMLKRRDTSSLWNTSQQTRHWLSWLAQAMVHHDQTVFYLEHMQADWY